MELADLQSWFGALSRDEKVVALLDIMHELTLVARGVFYEESLDPRRRMELLYDISETDHRFTSAARDIFHGVETYPDDVLWEITGWYARGNDRFGGLSPRDYLCGKSWER